MHESRVVAGLFPMAKTMHAVLPHGWGPRELSPLLSLHRFVDLLMKPDAQKVREKVRTHSRVRYVSWRMSKLRAKEISAGTTYEATCSLSLAALVQ